MPSSYSPNLRLELIAPGEQLNTWGNTTNVNLGTLLESSITGATLITTLPYTLTARNGAADTARNMTLLVTASLSADSYVVAPASPKMYIVNNATVGGHNVTIKADLGSGVFSTGVVIPNGQSRIVYYSTTINDFFAAATYDILVNGTAGTTPAASGLVKTGNLSNGTLSLTVAPATSTSLGGVKPNATQFTTASDGALTLNPPSGSSVGGVKSGAIVLADVSGALGLAASGVSAGSYSNATVVVDIYGRVTSASSGVASGVTSVSGSAPINVSPATGAVTVSLATAGTAGTYGYPTSVSVDAYGRVTAISGGSAPTSGVTSVSVTAPITNTGTSTAPIIGITAGTYLPIAGGTLTGQVVSSVSLGSNNLLDIRNTGTGGTGIYCEGVLYALYGFSSTGYGVRATATNSYGIFAQSSSGTYSAGLFNNTVSAINCELATPTYGLNSTASISVNGTVYPSDSRLKENDANIQNALATVMRLRPVSFDWKAESFRGIRAKAPVSDYGFIAQEVETVIEHIVYDATAPARVEGADYPVAIEETLSSYKGVDYSRIIPFLTAAIQELNAKVEAQAAEIAALKGA